MTLPKPETMLIYASILEKPQYYIDAVTGAKYLLPTGEIIEAACAALRYCAATTGGESRAAVIEECARFIEQTYRDEPEEVLRATFIVPESSTGTLQAWHQASDVAAAIRDLPTSPVPEERGEK